MLSLSHAFLPCETLDLRFRVCLKPRSLSGSPPLHSRIVPFSAKPYILACSRGFQSLQLRAGVASVPVGDRLWRNNILRNTNMYFYAPQSKFYFHLDMGGVGKICNRPRMRARICCITLPAFSESRAGRCSQNRPSVAYIEVFRFLLNGF